MHFNIEYMFYVVNLLNVIHSRKKVLKCCSSITSSRFIASPQQEDLHSRLAKPNPFRSLDWLDKAAK